MNRLLFIVSVFLATAVFQSCKITIVPRDEISIITGRDSCTVSNVPTRQKIPLKDATLLSIFGITEPQVDSVTIKFDGENQLVISYKPYLAKVGKEVKFQGSFSSKGYYEIYLRNRNIEVPPFIPLYVNADIDRKRIYKLNNGNIVIENYTKKGRGLILTSTRWKKSQLLFSKRFKLE